MICTASKNSTLSIANELENELRNTKFELAARNRTICARDVTISTLRDEIRKLRSEIVILNENMKSMEVKVENCENLKNNVDRKKTKIHDAGIDVSSIVSDIGPKNQGLWRDLGVCKVSKGEIGSTSIR